MQQTQDEKLTEIIASAHRLGVELDEKEARNWLSAMDLAKEKDDDVVFDVRSGVFGQNIAMLDFSPERLAYFKRLAPWLNSMMYPARLKQP